MEAQEETQQVEEAPSTDAKWAGHVEVRGASFLAGLAVSFTAWAIGQPVAVAVGVGAIAMLGLIYVGELLSMWIHGITTAAILRGSMSQPSVPPNRAARRAMRR